MLSQTRRDIIQLCDESLAYDDPPRHAGDMVSLALDTQPDEGQLCGVVIGKQLFVRYVYYLPSGRVRFEARNHDYPPLREKLARVYILGVISAG